MKNKKISNENKAKLGKISETDNALSIDSVMKLISFL